MLAEDFGNLTLTLRHNSMKITLRIAVPLFYVVILLTTAKKWTKANNARAGKCQVNMQICDVLVAVSVVVA